MLLCILFAEGSFKVWLPGTDFYLLLTELPLSKSKIGSQAALGPSWLEYINIHLGLLKTATWNFLKLKITSY